MSKRKKKKDKRKKRSTAETAKRRAETHKTGFDNTAFELPEDVKLYSLKSEKGARLDIIPYEVGEGNPYADQGGLHYERTYFVHRNIGVDQTSYICLSKTCGEKCPICEFRSKLAKDPDADEDLIKDLAPKERQLFNVIDTKDKSKGVQIWEISYHLFGKPLDREIKNSDEDDGYEKFAELKNGFTLKLGVEESHAGKASWFEVVTINFKSRKEDYDEEILEQTTCLDEILIIKDYDELKEIFLQTTDTDDEDEEEEKPSKKKKSSKKKKDEDDDEDLADNEDEDEEDEDDEENDTDKDSDEDEDEWDDSDEDSTDENEDDEEDEDNSDEDDDDEDEKPAKKKKKDKKKSTGKKSKDSKGKGKKKDKDKDKKKKKDKKGKKNKCPGGGTFGKNTNELDECTDCPKWDDCDDA